jgi:LysR family transcriptional regulator, low CO2-responsive transcriptional regulator
MLRPDAVTLRQLRALAAVSRLGSMTAAGKELGLTAPAIHSQIRGLEDAIGAPVLQRLADASGSGLTTPGRVLLEGIERIEAALMQALGRITAIQAGKEGRVVLGVVSTAKYFAPRLVQTLRQLHPGIEVVLQVGNREEILRDLAMMRLDLTIMGRPPRHPPVDAQPIGPHPHGLIASPSHRLAGLRALSAADLAGETFLSREEGSGTRILMTRYLDRLGEGQPFDLVEMGSNETIKQAAMAGLGVGFLSLHTVADELRTGTLVRLAAPGLPIERHWFLVRHLQQPEQPTAAVLATTILNLKGSFLPRIP